MFIIISFLISTILILLISFKKCIEVKNISLFYIFFNINMYFYFINYYFIIIFSLYFILFLNKINLPFVEIYSNILNNSTTHCQSVYNETNRSDFYFNSNHKTLISQHKQATNLHKLIYSCYHDKTNFPQINLHKDEQGIHRYDNYKVERVSKYLTEINPNTGNFGFKDLSNFGSRDEGIFMFTERAVSKYYFSFLQEFKKFYNYNMAESTDPLLNYTDIACFLRKTTSVCNNLVVEVVKDPKNYIKMSNPRITHNEIYNLISSILPLYDKTEIYLNNMQESINPEESPRFTKNLNTLLSIYQLDLANIQSLFNISSLGGNKSFMREPKYLESFLFKTQTLENFYFSSSKESLSSLESINTDKSEISSDLGSFLQSFEAENGALFQDLEVGSSLDGETKDCF